jgi:hypothetical protein
MNYDIIYLIEHFTGMVGMMTEMYRPFNIKMLISHVQYDFNQVHPTIRQRIIVGRHNRQVPRSGRPC